MACDMYKGDRHVNAHGAVATPGKENPGLDAGCALAMDILKAFIATNKTERPEGKPRDYVDDISHSGWNGPQRQNVQPGCTPSCKNPKALCEERLWRSTMASNQSWV